MLLLQKLRFSSFRPIPSNEVSGIMFVATPIRLCGSNSESCKSQVHSPSLSNLTSLQRFEVQNNLVSGSISPLASLPSLQFLLLNNNSFTSIPSNFFKGMSSLYTAYLDKNPFETLVIPTSLQDSTALTNFFTNSANVKDSIPDFFGPDGWNQALISA